jgi:hypothetical protein
MRASASVLLGVHATLLILSLPMVAFMMLGSLWEGGDLALKHRLLSWGLLSFVVAIVAIVVLFMAVAAVGAGRASALPVTLSATLAVLVLAAGWAWVWQGDLLAGGVTLAFWLLLTLPAVVALVLLARVERGGLRPGRAAPARRESAADRRQPPSP